MDCVEFHQLIPLFFEGLLDDNQLDQFADHVVACTACEKCLLSAANKDNSIPQKALG
jgi:hypothetical protein